LVVVSVFSALICKQPYYILELSGCFVFLVAFIERAMYIVVGDVGEVVMKRSSVGYSKEKRGRINQGAGVDARAEFSPEVKFLIKAAALEVELASHEKMSSLRRDLRVGREFTEQELEVIASKILASGDL